MDMEDQSGPVTLIQQLEIYVPWHLESIIIQNVY